MPRSRTTRQKTFQTIFVETVLFISLFALVGHISLNFWERYVVQKELVQMKSSLYSLKETINHIGVAYTNLYTELKGLADMAEGDYAKLKPKLKFSKYKPDIAQDLLKNVQAHAIIDSGISSGIDVGVEKKNKRTQTVASKLTQSNEFSHKEAPQRNGDHIHLKGDKSPHPKGDKSPQPRGDKSPQPKDDKVSQLKGDKSPQPQPKDKKDKTSATSNKLPHHTEISHIHLKTVQDKKMTNAATTTKNPSKSMAAGTDEIENLLEEINARRKVNNNPGRENIHKCDDKEHSTSKERPTIDFAKF